MFGATSVSQENLSALARGVQELGGVEFDVRGIVHLTSKVLKKYTLKIDFPEAVTNIAVGQPANRLYFLHSAAWGHQQPHGVEIGAYVVHFADGQETRVPIRMGEHLRNWWLPWPGKHSVSAGQLVWQIDSRKADGRVLGLYSMSWENPRPNVAIDHIDFVSTMGDAAPFLLAITVE